MSSVLRAYVHPNRYLVLLAIVSVGLCCLGWYLSSESFFIAYLAGVLLPWSISIGSLTWLLIAELTGGRWIQLARPWLLAYSKLMPLVAVLFLPWVLGTGSMYPWADEDFFAPFENTSHRDWYYQTPFLIGRTAGYFVLWMFLAWLIQGTEVRGGQAAAGLGLIAILLSVTWASMDWMMSFDPFFASSLFGVWVGGGAMLAGLAAAMVGVCSQLPGPGDSASRQGLADLASLLLASLMLWAYFSFSQFLIIWNANLPGEAQYYILRSRGLWAIITPAISLLGFVVPFLFLLSYRFKRSRRWIGNLAGVLLGVRAIELAWIVLPASDGEATRSRLLLMVPALGATIALFAIGAERQVRRNRIARSDSQSKHRRLNT